MALQKLRQDFMTGYSNRLGPVIRERTNMHATQRYTKTGAVLLALLISSGCCPHAQVNAFSVERPMACPGVQVQVQWNVKGRASLRAERGANDWDEGVVPSEGERTVSLVTTTAFTVRALDANPADSQSFGWKQVEVPQNSSQARAAPATCDATSRKCTGSFDLDTGESVLLARRLSAPTLIRRGVDTPIRVCVVHEGLTGNPCVPPGGELIIPAGGIAANGTWMLEADLAPGESLDPPPQLRVNIDFGCL